MTEVITTPVIASDNTNADFVALSFLVRYSNKLTRDSYGRSLRQYFAWCYEHGLDPLAAKRVHIEAWARHLEQAGNEKGTVSTKLKALAGFYKFAHIDGVIDADPMLHVARPKIQRQSSTNGFTRSELWAIREAAEAHSARAHAIICLLAFNGLRVSELLGIQVGDIGFDRGFQTIFIRRRKSDLQQTVPLSQLTAWAVTTYLDGHTTGPLFVTSSGASMNRQAVDRIVKRLARSVGIDKRISPHSFRHAFCTLSHDAGVSERNIQHGGGWADLRMVAYYDRGGQSMHRHPTHMLTAFVAGVE